MLCLKLMPTKYWSCDFCTAELCAKLLWLSFASCSDHHCCLAIRSYIRTILGDFVGLNPCGKISTSLLIAIIRVEQFLCCLGCWNITIQGSQASCSQCRSAMLNAACPHVRGPVFLSALQLAFVSCAAWAWVLGHFFLLSSGTVCLSYVLFGKKAEFCPKTGYFQLDCCSYVTR